MSRSKRIKNPIPKAPFSFRHNLLPPLVGLFVMVGALGLLNAQWISAQVVYRFNQPAPLTNELLVSTKSPEPQAGPQLIIPKIGVKAPVVFDEPSVEEWRLQLALRRGVVHYGSTALPGQVGNSVIVGHSSGQIWAPGDYKFIFTLLNKVSRDDKVIVDYDSTRYIYNVTSTEVVTPDNTAVLYQQESKPMLTLITCTPPGTNLKRLLVHAEQISPKFDPATQFKTPESNSPVPTQSLPASASSSLWQTMRSWFQ